MSLASDTRLFTLENTAGLRIQVMDHGATWVSCSVPLADGSRREVLLGCASLASYQSQTAYLGATIGRYANRIRDARFVLDGVTHQLVPNEGANQLHGGPAGFDRRVWQVESHAVTELVMSLVSEAGDQGYPGRMDASVHYALGDDLSVRITMQATVTQACPVNMTQHAYFNLDGDAADADCRPHRLRIAARSFLPVNTQSIPIGERRAVGGTGFDFREPQTVGEALLRDEQQQLTQGYDHSYWLDAGCADGSRPAAEVQAGDGRVSLQLFTSLPGLQFYSGNHLAGTPARVGHYVKHAGLALEPQYPPDSPNHPEWPSCVLRPGERYQQTVRYRFVAAPVFAGGPF